MAKVGGNVEGKLQRRTAGVKNAIGERVESWENVITLTGWLDYGSGESQYADNKAKVEGSTHVFICDYNAAVGVKSTDKRMVIEGSVYDVLLIDDPMRLHQHLEIYLKLLGGDV